MHMSFPRGYRPYVWGILALAVLGGGSFAVTGGDAAAGAPTAAELSKELHGFIVPDVVMGGETYAVSDGAVTRSGAPVGDAAALPVLRVAYFSVANRLDPLFALEGTDPEKLATAVAQLDGSLHALSALYDDAAGARLAKNFYPLAFLQTLPVLERDRRAVLAHPTPENAAQYRDELRAALSRYRAALADSASAFDAVNAESASMLFSFPGGTITLDSVHAGLTALNAAAGAAAAKADARAACLGGRGPCEPLGAPLPQDADALRVPALPPTLPLQSARIKALLSASERSRSGSLGESFQETGVVVFPASACVPDFSPFYAYVWETAPKSGVPALRFQPLNDLYFYDLRKKTQSEFYNRIRASGIDLFSQGISNFYECPDSGLEIGRVAAASALASAVAAHPLFANATSSDPALLKVAADERRILDGALISEEEEARYVADVADLVRTRGESALARELSPETVLEAERRIALMQSRSALFDEQIGTAISMNDVVKGIGAIANGPMPLLPLYMSRSYLSLFYLAGNGSVSPTPVSFFAERTAEPLSKFQIVTYTSLQNSYTDADILRFLNISTKKYAAIGR